MNPAESRSTRIAVFIDFDNVEIGVKSTIGGQFDIGLVLEAIKERGEIVTKIAYSDWKRAGDYSRILTQHAIRMVQRSFTPGGDKNGADITMALDALEMAFTHDHINAFVIVGGDSDFISLVEKLKQYGRKVIVVGGRQFTSVTMQKNCHEFIAYENLTGGRGRTSERGRPAASSTVAQALPLVKRALKVLSDREVTPQLGLLKSTLLQLDSTFSERDYGASSFRDFMEKVAEAGAVTLRHSGRSMLVEAVDEPSTGGEEGTSPAAAPAAAAPAAPAPAAPPPAEPLPSRPLPADLPQADVAMDDEETMPASPMSVQDGIRAVQQAFTQAAQPPRWPMYLRQAKQYLRNAVEGFDERKYGFASVVDLLRAAGKEGVVRLERDRQGAIRVFPGANMVPASPASDAPMVDLEENVDVEVPADRVVAPDDSEPLGGEVADGSRTDRRGAASHGQAAGSHERMADSHDAAAGSDEGAADSHDRRAGWHDVSAGAHGDPMTPDDRPGRRDDAGEYAVATEPEPGAPEMGNAVPVAAPQPASAGVTTPIGTGGAGTPEAHHAGGSSEPAPAGEAPKRTRARKTAGTRATKTAKTARPAAPRARKAPRAKTGRSGGRDV